MNNKTHLSLRDVVSHVGRSPLAALLCGMGHVSPIYSVMLVSWQRTESYRKQVDSIKIINILITLIFGKTCVFKH